VKYMMLQELLKNKKFQELEKQISLSFNNKIFTDFNEQNIQEEVKYSISLSLKDSLDIEEVIFKVDDKIIETFKDTTIN
ncbi:MAG: hypothetical protein K2J20_04660, partial [Bacilli bacterium]|nr:hypothetical protein [Bacilli bacterium]